MTDIIERLENCAERRFADITKDLPEGKFKCFCGNIDNLWSAMPSSNNPYCMPICRKCYEGENHE